MKLERWMRFLWGCLLSFVISLAGVGCLITAFPFSQGMGMGTAMLGLSICSVLSSGLLCLRRGGLLLGLVSLGATLLGIFQLDLLQQLKALIYHLSSCYDNAYHWGIAFSQEPELAQIAIGGGLLVIGCGVCMAVAVTVCRRQGLIGALVLGILPLMACCVVTDTVPATEHLFLLVAGMVLLTLIQGPAKGDHKAVNRLIALLLIPVMLFTWLIFSVATPQAYEKHQQSLQGLVQQLIPQLGIGEGEVVLPAMATEVSLNSVGPKEESLQPVMDVMIGSARTLYLRGQAFDSYGGESWSLGPGSTQTDPYWPITGLNRVDTVKISTRSPQAFFYIPFYTKNMDKAQSQGVNALQDNPQGKQTYDFIYCVPSLAPQMKSVAQSLEQAQNYLLLPPRTLERARKILQDNQLIGQTMQDTAYRIFQFVRGIAEYDLSAPQMPVWETDFALWFIEQGEKGYCVHYASAATVLLRAAGVPARYVTGYLVETKRNTRITVQKKDAHAWVEYLDEQLCWKRMDATPGYGAIATPTPTMPSNPPTTTQEVTEPTVQTQWPTAQNPEPTITFSTYFTETIAGRPEQPEDNRDVTALWTGLTAVAGVMATVLMAVGQYALRRSRRRKATYTGAPNAQALAKWRYLCKAGKLLKQPATPELRELAEKAMFSQHTLTQEELAELENQVQVYHTLLAQKNPLHRLWLKLIFALG